MRVSFSFENFTLATRKKINQREQGSLLANEGTITIVQAKLEPDWVKVKLKEEKKKNLQDLIMGCSFRGGEYRKEEKYQVYLTGFRITKTERTQSKKVVFYGKCSVCRTYT